MEPESQPDSKPPLATPAYAAPQRFPDADLAQLALFFKIGGWITCAFSLCALPHTIVGMVFVANPDGWGNNPPPPGFGWLFLLMGGMFFSGYLALGITTLFGAGWIAQRRRRTWLLVISAISCLHMPIGMALGIYSLILLNRDDIKAAISNN